MRQSPRAWGCIGPAPIHVCACAGWVKKNQTCLDHLSNILFPLFWLMSTTKKAFSSMRVVLGVPQVFIKHCLFVSFFQNVLLDFSYFLIRFFLLLTKLKISLCLRDSIILLLEIPIWIIFWWITKKSESFYMEAR